MKRISGICLISILGVSILQLIFFSSQAQTISNRDYKPHDQKISLAYVESGRSEIPDPYIFTHLIYAFCEFNEDNDGVVISNPERLREIAALKQSNPDLKVILGVGGYKKEGFSEMARDKKKRRTFESQCKEIIADYNLDGIDLDWEFPGTTAGGHTATPGDAKNYGTLVKELRKTLGKDAWISFYSNNSGKFIDFRRMIPYVDYVNVSGYNLSTPQPGKKLNHQSPLYSSDICGSWSVSKSIARHLELGVPRNKILLGIPFFGRGKEPFPSYVEDRALGKYTAGCHYLWDDIAKAPLYVNSDGILVVGFDNEQSIEEKCQFIISEGLGGGFVWNYDADYEDHRLARTMKKHLIQK